MSKRFSKYIVSFDYFDKSLIVVSATTGSISIATLIGAPIGIASGSFSLAFFYFYRNCKNAVQSNKKKNKKKHNKTFMLGRSKLNSIESKIFKALVNNEISHENFMTGINEQRYYREIKKP